MKKLFSYICILVCAVALFSCDKDSSTTNPYAVPSAISIESVDVYFQATGGNGTVKCNTPNGIKRVDSKAPWCTASFKDNIVTVQVEKNNDISSRMTTLDIYAENDKMSVTVQQAGLTFCINNGDDVQLTAAPQSKDYPIEYAGKGTLAIVGGQVDWADLSIVDNKLHADLLVNIETEPRSTEVELSDGEVSTTLKITQGGLYFTVNDGEDYAAGDDASTKVLRVSTVEGLEYTVEPSEVDWATFKVVKDGVQVVLAANNSGAPRFTKAVITYAGNLQKEVLISQYEFVDAIGEFDMIYNGTNSIPITIEKAGNGRYQLRFPSMNNYSGDVIMPIQCDENNYTITLANVTEMEGTYTKSGTDYSLMAMVSYTNGTNVYRKNEPLLVLLGKFDPQTSTWNFEFDPNNAVNHSSYQYYAFRIAYTTGGYAGYMGAATTFAYMYQWKKRQ